MTACSEKLQFAGYVAESAHAEASTDMTGAQRVPITAMFNLDTIRQDFIVSSRVVQYKNEVPTNIVGPWANAEFTLEFELTGHGSTTEGAVSIVAVENLLGWIVGGVVRTATSGTTCSATGTAVALTTTASGTFAPGGMFLAGGANDARAGGQWNVVESHATNTLTGEVAYAAAPINTDKVYAAVNMYTLETTCAMDSKRFLLATADMQLVCHGCVVKGYTLTGLNPGEVAKCTATIGVSWAEPVSTTFPNTAATAAWTFNPAPHAAGSIFLAAYGTSTRDTDTILACRSFTVSVTKGYVSSPSYDLPNRFAIHGAGKATPDTIKVSVVIDANGPSATPRYFDAARTNARQHLLAGLSINPGSALGFYFPNLAWDGSVPTQTPTDGINRITLNFAAGTDTAETTSDLSLSAMRIGFA